MPSPAFAKVLTVLQRATVVNVGQVNLLTNKDSFSCDNLLLYNF